MAFAPELVTEVLHGTPYSFPPLRLRHARARSRLVARLDAALCDDWIVLNGPELHLGHTPDVLVPELAGWRRERMAELPDAAFTTVPPDWVCEILSPATEQVDRAEKLPIYAREGVAHVWLVEPVLQTLEVFRLVAETYRLSGAWRGEAVLRAEPFDAIELSLASLWAR